MDSFFACSRGSSSSKSSRIRSFYGFCHVASHTWDSSTHGRLYTPIARASRRAAAAPGPGRPAAYHCHTNQLPEDRYRYAIRTLSPAFLVCSQRPPIMSIQQNLTTRVKKIISCSYLVAECKSDRTIALGRQDFEISQPQRAESTVFEDIWGYVMGTKKNLADSYCVHHWVLLFFFIILFRFFLSDFSFSGYINLNLQYFGDTRASPRLQE